jgi:hypothetical protein
VRLVELNPRWQQDRGRLVGLNFDCPGPCCVGKPSARDLFDARERAGEAKIIIAVPFKTDLAGADYRDDGWDRTGDTFETLTLAPSIQSYGFDRAPHWHGFVRAGEIVNA